eukprot:7226020-Pyramimonas_sp.AAC.2
MGMATARSTLSDGKASPKPKSAIRGLLLGRKPAARAFVSKRAMLSMKLRPRRKPRWGAGEAFSTGPFRRAFIAAATSLQSAFLSAIARVALAARHAPSIRSSSSEPSGRKAIR